MWVPQANEECQRAPNHQPPSPERSQATLRLRRQFPKTARFKTRQEFKRVQREGKRHQALFLAFQHASEKFTCCSLGITVSKHFGNAVARNLFKRRVREVFRTLKHQLPAGLKLHISPRPAAGLPTLKQVETDFRSCMDHLTPC